MQSLYGFDRKNWLWATALMLGALLYSPEAEATSLGKRRASVVLPAIEQASMLVPVAPALTPLGFTRFCFAYPEQCNPGKPILRPKPRLAVRAMIQDLDTINRRINRRIRPVADQAGLINDLWTIGPVMGDCDDYAVTKRAELIKAGWSPRSLLLAQVATPSGDLHLVLVARTRFGDYVLDNLTDRVLLVAETNLRWISAQTSANPNHWYRVSVGTLKLRAPSEPAVQAVAFADWKLRL